MKITRVTLTKEKLASLSERDRTLFLLLGNVTNELSILQKLLMMTRKGPPPSKMVDIVEAGQMMFFLRLLVGKVHEGGVLLQKRVNEDANFRERYGLDEKRRKDRSELRKELSRVNRHFRRWGGLLNAIRDKLAFHSTDNEGLVEKSFARLSTDEPWDFYLSPQTGNSFYYAAELVLSKSAIDLTHAGSAAAGGRATEEAGLVEMHESAIVAAGLLTHLFNILMLEIVDKGVNEALEAEEVDVEGPRLDGFHLPFFFDMTGISKFQDHDDNDER